MTTIFISYRRDDAAAYAGRLYDGLRERYGEDHIFMDVDRIQPGEHFAAVIERSIRSADVVLVVIGETWLTATNDSQKRRLDDPEDFVRLEILSALEANRRVIPVLVGDAVMPTEQSLPPVLRRLAELQAVTLSNERWDYDSERLTRSIDGGERPGLRRKWLWGVAVLGLALVMLALFVTKRHPTPMLSGSVTLRSGPAVLTADQARAMLVRHNFFHAQWNTAGAPPLVNLERQVIGADVVVNETRYQLMWQQRASSLPLGRNGVQAHLQELNERQFAGYSDWRLPTLEEAMTLMASGSTEDCRLHKLFDRSGLVIRTADTTDSAQDWVIYFCDGIAVPEVAGFSAHVRAVRSLR